MPRPTAIEAKNYPACRLTYQGNVLLCFQHRTFDENYRTAKQALDCLLGFSLTDEQIKENGTIERFRTIGNATNDSD